MSHDLLGQLEQIEHTARAELARLAEPDAVQAFRVRYLGRKGALTGILRQMGTLTAEERPRVGQRANEIKTCLEHELSRLQQALQRQAVSSDLADRLDVTLPGRRLSRLGHVHPITAMMHELQTIFLGLGFSIHDGPNVENEYYNFEALNMPADHPARDMQDTFYLHSEGTHCLLRTHTSPVQIRVMEHQKPPIRVIVPGAVFRRDADVTHSPMFHQIEGLFVDEGINFMHLKGVLTKVVEEIFGDGVCARFRPSYFPFTEPSAEMDLGYTKQPDGVRLARRGEAVSGWLEILGCGMVDPAVFEAVGYDASQCTGFAFGLGVERIAMLKWGIDDIREFFESDVRFLEQFA